jgi:hypothetical protein
MNRPPAENLNTITAPGIEVSREKLVRQRVDPLAQIRALSRQLESIDRQLDDIAHAEAAHTGD